MIMEHGLLSAMQTGQLSTEQYRKCSYNREQKKMKQQQQKQSTENCRNELSKMGLGSEKSFLEMDIKERTKVQGKDI